MNIASIALVVALALRLLRRFEKLDRIGVSLLKAYCKVTRNITVNVTKIHRLAMMHQCECTQKSNNSDNNNFIYEVKVLIIFFCPFIVELG